MLEKALPDDGELANISRVDHVLKSDDPTLRQLAREYTQKICFEKYGPDKLRAMPKAQQWEIFNQHFPKTNIIGVIKAYIVSFTAKVNVKQTLNESQVDAVAKLMYNRFSWKASDLKVFFNNISSGVYGGFYENLSPEKIMEWAEIYLEDRAKVAELLNMGEEKPFNGTTKVHPEVIKVMFEGVGTDKPKALEKKENVFLNNEKAFRAYVANQSKELYFVEVVEAFEKWQLNNALIGYCDIFIEELQNRKKGNPEEEILEVCRSLFKIKHNTLPAALNNSHFLEIEELEKKLNIFIKQNKIK